MSRDNIKQGIIAILVDLFMCDPDSINDQTVASDVDGWDSLSHTILLLETSMKFNITIDEKESFENIGKLIDYVYKLIGVIAVEKNSTDDITIELEKIKSLIVAKEFVKAESLIVLLLKLHTKNIRLRQEYFKVLWQLKRIDEAGAFALETLKINPKSILSLRNCALFYSKKKLFGEALLYLDKALEIKKLVAIYMDRINIYSRIGKLKQKEIEYELNQLIELAPQNYKALEFAAEKYADLKKHEKALYLIEKATSIRVEKRVSLKVYNELEIKLCSDKVNTYEWKDLSKLSFSFGKFMIKNPRNDKLPYYFFMNDKAKDKNRLFVNFHGAIEQSVAKIPAFARWNWHSLIPGKILAVADPTLFLDSSLSLGWYLGTPETDSLLDILEVVKTIAYQNEIDLSNIVMYGSSGGGHAAIRGASLLGCSAVVINPQINILQYYPRPVLRLEHCFGGKLEELIPIEKLDLTSTILNGKFKKLLYVQNIKDTFHYNNYFIPVKESVERMQINTDKIDFYTYNSNNGHAPIPMETYEYISRKYLDSNSYFFD